MVPRTHNASEANNPRCPPCRPRLPLYTEAIKLFAHGEGMVRAAVRMVTINVYAACGHDAAALDFVASAPCSHYFHEVALHVAGKVVALDRHLDALLAGAPELCW